MSILEAILMNVGLAMDAFAVSICTGLELKNIKFIECSENDAETYLRENNNYYNVTAYKNNFVKILSLRRNNSCLQFFTFKIKFINSFL